MYLLILLACGVVVAVQLPSCCKYKEDFKHSMVSSDKLVSTFLILAETNVLV